MMTLFTVLFQFGRTSVYIVDSEFKMYLKREILGFWSGFVL